MKKLIYLLLCVALLLGSLWGCSNDPLPITDFIDESVDQFANNHQMLALYDSSEQFTLTEEQWQSIRNLFNEMNWVELKDYKPLNDRNFEGFMSFWSIDDTISFLIPELIVQTIEFNKSKFVRNRYFTIDKETVELIEAQMADFAALK